MHLPPPSSLQPAATSPLATAATAAATLLLHALNDTTTPGSGDGDGAGGGGEGKDPKKELQNWSSLIGIVTAIVGNVLIALALNVQRYAHTRLHRRRVEVRERARLALRRAQKHGVGSGQQLDGDEDVVGGGGGRGGYGTLDGGGRDRENSDDGGGGGGGDDETDPLMITTSSISRNGSRSLRSSESSGFPSSEDSGMMDGMHNSSTAGSTTNYLKSPYWWLGQVLITVGEMGNFLAYGFAPASIVSPLGVVALVSNCVIAPIFFNEVFRQRDFWGVIVAVAGAVTVVLSAKTEETKLAPHDVWNAITTLAFEVYVAITVALIALLMWASPRYGNRSILIDLGLVGLFGGYTALATKGVSSMLSSTLLGAFTTPVTYALVFVLLATAVMQVRYVNKALQRFDSTQVIPIQFVTFTLSVIVGSAVLYRDFEHTTPQQAVKFVGGCFLTFFGVFLITSGRPRQDDEDDELSDVEGVEETINLHEQAHDGAAAEDGHGSAAAGADAGGSRRSSRVSFMDAVISKPLTILTDTGFPSMRMPPANSNNNRVSAAPLFVGSGGGDGEGSPLLGGGGGGPNGHNNNPWRDSPPSSAQRAYSADSAVLASESPSAAVSEPASALATPSGSSNPQAPLLLLGASAAASSTPSADGPVTPRPPPVPLVPALGGGGGSSSRPHSHHFSGPLFSPSPLSSTVSAVVADTLLRHHHHHHHHHHHDGGGAGGTGSPSARRVPHRRSRPSLRTSLFMPYEDDDDGGEERRGGGGGVSAADEAKEESNRRGAGGGGGFRGRARSLSNTLGEFFGSGGGGGSGSGSARSRLLRRGSTPPPAAGGGAADHRAVAPRPGLAGSGSRSADAL